MPLPFNNGYPGYQQNINYPYFQQQQQSAMYQQNYAQPQNQNMNYYSFVNGIEGAKAFQVPAGKSILLMDSDNPIFYHKSANEMGQATIKTYRFEEVTEHPKQEASYMTKEDVEAMIKDALSSQKFPKKTTAGE